MGSYTFGIAVRQAIIESLVITEVESLLLQLPLSIPVCLSDKKKLAWRTFYRRNQIGPVFSGGLQSGAAAPGLFKDRVQEKHRHIAANAVTLAGDVHNCFNCGLTESGIEGIQLQHIAPWREVRISAKGEYSSV